MPPIDPSPYRTIASALRTIRDSRPMPTPAEQRATRVRDRATLRTYLDRQRTSPAAQAARDARVSEAVANRFRDTYGDYT